MPVSISIALIVNPLAGLGGSVALKGSDQVSEQALALGAEPKAQQRSIMALQDVAELLKDAHWYTCDGAMGANVLTQLGIPFERLDVDIPEHTGPEQTIAAAQNALAKNVDLILFAGGDGTARDICSVVEDRVPVLGIPAGVKIHSGVYAVTPHAAGEVLKALLSGELVDIAEQEVRDIDEEAFRHNKVQARYYGEMKVPKVGQFVQHTKSGGREVEELVLQDIAAWLVQEMEPDTLYLIGSGKSTAAIMDELGLDNTLLGVDAVFDNELVGSDLTEKQILELLEQHPKAKAVLSVIGGQGHILGRGNQQFSPAVIRELGKENIQLIATKGKLKGLEGRPLIVDSGDRELDLELCGQWSVLTGFDDYVWYSVATF